MSNHLADQPRLESPPHGLLPVLLAQGDLDVALRALDEMALGGLYDLLGGGFVRYSVDAPHFEKSLYDTAQLVSTYVDAFKISEAPHHERVVRQSLTWALREMRLPEGGFAARLDVGAGYVWTHEQLVQAVGSKDAHRLAPLLGVESGGRFARGASVLRLEHPIEEHDLRERNLLRRVLPLLRSARARRAAPVRDHELVLSWNGLMSSALARGAAAFGEETWAAEAAITARRVLTEGPAQADALANLLVGLLDLYGCTFDPVWLDEAQALVEPLILAVGTAEPAARAAAALAFVRLADLCGREDLRGRAEALLVRPSETLAGAWLARGPTRVAVVGEPAACAAMLQEVRRRYLPCVTVAAVRSGGDPRLPWTEGKEAVEGGPTGWICAGSARLPPAVSAGAWRQALDRLARPPVAIRAEPSERPAAPPWPPYGRWLNLDEAPSLEGLRGQVVALCFWARHSVESQLQLEALEALSAELGHRVVVLSVHSNKFTAAAEGVEGALQRLGVSHPVLLDPEQELWQRYQLKRWPAVLLLDAEGRVAWRGGLTGLDDLRSLALTLLDESPPAQGPVFEPMVHGQVSSPLAWPTRVHVYPDATMQELGADALQGGRLYVADTGHHRVIEGRLEAGADGWPVLHELRSFGGGPGFTDGVGGLFRAPRGLVRHGQTLYVADTGNHALRAIELESGAVRTLAGTGAPGPRRHRGLYRTTRPRERPLRAPYDVEILDVKGEPLVLVACAGAHQIWAYGLGHLGLFAGDGEEDHVDGPAPFASLAQPTALTMFGRYLLFTDSSTSSVRGVDLQQHGVVTVVGQGPFDFGDVNGRGEGVRMQGCMDLTFLGNDLYVADTLNHKIKRIQLSQLRAQTVAGGEGLMCEPEGVDRLGRFLVVADTGNHRLVVVEPATGEVRGLRLR